MTAAGSGRPGRAIQAATFSDCSASRLYAATLRAVGEAGFIITAQDAARMTLGFRPGAPTAAWPYEQMTATVVADGSGGARLIFAGAPGGGATLAMNQWHQGHAIAMMVVDRLKSVLPEVPEPPV